MIPTNITPYISCPFCTGYSVLEEQPFTQGIFMLIYYCKVCGNGFTTTESDTISLNRLSSKTRSIERINKINKIVKTK